MPQIELQYIEPHRWCNGLRARLECGRSGQTKYYANGICCVSAKHTALKRKSKDWLALNHANVLVWDDMSI